MPATMALFTKVAGKQSYALVGNGARVSRLWQALGMWFGKTERESNTHCPPPH
jgi:hypothetical protein